MDLFGKMKWLILTIIVRLAMSKPTSQLTAKTEMLEVLDLSQNHLSVNSLPIDSPQNNATLETYTMIHNKQIIITLPSGFFANMTRLKNLKLTKIGLFKVPEDLIWGSTKIESLYMDKNYLQSITLGFFRDCKNLKKLILKNNLITYLPDNIFSTLENLEILDLSSNEITNISQNLLNGLFSLRVIKMEHNRLMEIDQLAFQNLKSLQVAHFSYNNLKFNSSILGSFNMSTSSSPFEFCKNTLEELYMDHNNITELFYDWISAPRLQTLNLAHNKLSSLELSGIWTQIINPPFLSNKINVDMAHNEIHNIYLRNFKVLLGPGQDLREILINVQENPISCDCDLYGILKLIGKQSNHNVSNIFSLNVDNLKCHKPEELKGIEIINLKSKLSKCDIESPMNDFLCPPNCKCLEKSSDKIVVNDCIDQELVTESELLFNIIADNIFSKIFICTYVVFVIFFGVSFALNYESDTRYITEKCLDKDKSYESFVSFSQKAEEFINKQLVPKLKAGSKPFKLRVNYSKVKADESFGFKLQTL